MKMTRILTLAGLALTYMVLSSGAVMASDGVCTDTTYISSHGWVSKGYERSLVDARTAVEKSFRENQIKIVEKNTMSAAGSTRIKGQTDDATYWVALNSLTDRFTKVSVRTDAMGDLAGAKKIQCDIEENI